jgi:hypothetical protein
MKIPEVILMEVVHAAGNLSRGPGGVPRSVSAGPGRPRRSGPGSRLAAEGADRGDRR